jgi:hypothetical protein
MAVAWAQAAVRTLRQTQTRAVGLVVPGVTLSDDTEAALRALASSRGELVAVRRDAFLDLGGLEEVHSSPQPIHAFPP